MSLHRRFLLGLIVMYVSVEVVVVKATDLIRSVFILNTKWTNMEKTCEYHNAKVVIVPAVFSSPWIASQYPAHVPNWSPQLPLTVMRSLAQSTKGACVRCSPTPTPARLSCSVADVLHLLDDGLSEARQKFTHLSCSRGWEAGLTLPSCSGATSHVPLLVPGPPCATISPLI